MFHWEAYFKIMYQKSPLFSQIRYLKYYDLICQPLADNFYIMLASLWLFNKELELL